MIARYTFYILFLALCFLSCKKENESEPINFKYSYFPLSSGHESIYNVTIINIDDTMHYYDTVRYELKERVDSMFIDNTGNKAWRLERYKRNDSTQPWLILDVWVAQIVQNQAQQIEENQRFVKIVFPPEINKSWDGHVFNTLGSKTFEISGLDEPYTINNLYFDSVLTIEQENKETMINKYYTFEKYANNIGLIQRDTIAIDYAYIIYPIIPIEQRILRAHFYYQTLIQK
jgi:hypothetical protein